jgi:diguanylate cyclase (GGDEF)-like protein
MKLWINTEGKILEYPVTLNSVTKIGRDATNELVLQDLDVSRVHCQISAVDHKRFELQDLQSTNGTFLNGSKIDRSPLAPGDTIQIGDTLMICNVEVDVFSEKSDLPLDIPLTLKNNKRVTQRSPFASREKSKTDRNRALKASLKGRFQQLIVVTQRIASELDTTRLLKVVLTGAVRFAHANRGMVLLKIKGTYKFSVGCNLEGDDLLDTQKAFLDALISQAEKKQDIVQHVFHFGDQLPVSEKSTIKLEGIHSLVIPLLSPTHYEPGQGDDRRKIKSAPTIYGFLYLENEVDVLDVDSSGRQLLKAIAAQAAIALHNAHLYKQATTDSLTGLLNRHCFKRLLSESMEDARENNKQLAVAMIDLDFFKSINDNHGHPYGDSVLVEFSNHIQGLLRKGDLIGRYGGEEFIICLKDVFPADAHHVLDTLRKAINNERFGEKRLKLSCSVGVASFPTHAKTSDLLIKHADQSLYSAKKKGRDRVVLWSTDMDRIGYMQHPMAGFLTGNMARDQRFLDLFFQITRILTDKFPSRSTLKQVTKLVLEVIRADFLGLFIGTDIYEQRLIIKFTTSEIESRSTLHDQLSLIRRALEHQKTIVSDDFAPVSGVFPSYGALKDPSRNQGLHAIAIPLFAFGEICGAYFLEFSGFDDTYQSADLNFLETVSRQIALPLHFYHISQRPEGEPSMLPNLEDSGEPLS